jgi:hypothetical protein
MTTTLSAPVLFDGNPKQLYATCDPAAQTVTVWVGGWPVTVAAGQLARMLDCLRVEADEAFNCHLCRRAVPHGEVECDQCSPFGGEG